MLDEFNLEKSQIKRTFEEKKLEQESKNNFYKNILRQSK